MGNGSNEVWQHPMFHGGSEGRGHGIHVRQFFPLRLIKLLPNVRRQFHLVFEGQIRQDFSCFTAMVDLVEEVRIPMAARPIMTASAPTLRCVVWLLDSTDITVGDEGDLGQSLGHVARSQGLHDPVYICSTGTAMHGEGRNTCSFSGEGISTAREESDQPVRILTVRGISRTDWTLLIYRVDLVWVLEPHRPALVLHDFVNWAAHVDIDDIGLGVFLYEFCCACEAIFVATKELDRTGFPPSSI